MVGLYRPSVLTVFLDLVPDWQEELLGDLLLRVLDVVVREALVEEILGRKPMRGKSEWMMVTSPRVLRQERGLREHPLA